MNLELHLFLDTGLTVYRKLGQNLSSNVRAVVELTLDYNRVTEVVL